MIEHDEKSRSGGPGMPWNLYCDVILGQAQAGQSLTEAASGRQPPSPRSVPHRSPKARWLWLSNPSVARFHAGWVQQPGNHPAPEKTTVWSTFSRPFNRCHCVWYWEFCVWPCHSSANQRSELASGAPDVKILSSKKSSQINKNLTYPGKLGYIVTILAGDSHAQSS
ncbi:hypothetical protein VTO42DRAFT_8878 [Malbranchea cinnamomea]